MKVAQLPETETRIALAVPLSFPPHRKRSGNEGGKLETKADFWKRDGNGDYRFRACVLEGENGNEGLRGRQVVSFRAHVVSISQHVLRNGDGNATKGRGRVFVGFRGFASVHAGKRALEAVWAVERAESGALDFSAFLD